MVLGPRLPVRQPTLARFPWYTCCHFSKKASTFSRGSNHNLLVFQEATHWEFFRKSLPERVSPMTDASQLHRGSTNIMQRCAETRSKQARHHATHAGSAATLTAAVRQARVWVRAPSVPAGMLWRSATNMYWSMAGSRLCAYHAWSEKSCFVSRYTSRNHLGD